jgi:hypothetical protein
MAVSEDDPSSRRCLHEHVQETRFIEYGAKGVKVNNALLGVVLAD